MSNELARAILALKADGTRLLYGEATADNTVSLEGAATAVELPALAPVVAGDYCAVLAQGADRLILGPVNKDLMQAGVATATADANSRITVTFPTVYSAAPVVTATRASSSTSQLACQIYSVSASSVTFTVTSNDALQAGVSGIVIHWIAIGTPA